MYLDYVKWANDYYTPSIQGRHITYTQLKTALSGLHWPMEIIGCSVQNRPIEVYYIGEGATKVAIWAQMHGNESTCTKALVDLMHFLASENPQARQISQQYSLAIIPMLNPDGAEVYTRVNANQYDINRDFVEFTQPESRALEAFMQRFQPEWGYNMHDQRTIFGAGTTGKPATLSFLSPAYDATREFNAVRVKAAERINAMNQVLQNHIPSCVGRFDDSFNPNCVGDHFTAAGVSVILFEAGHHPGDYARELTRKWVFMALLASWLEPIKTDSSVQIINNYLNIPQNSIVFLDILYRNVRINYDNTSKLTNFASHFTEKLVDGRFVLEAVLTEWPVDKLQFAHTVIDAKGAAFDANGLSSPKFGEIANFNLGNDIKIVNGMKLI